MKAKNKNQGTIINRRSFLSTSFKTGIALTIVPSNVIGGLGHIAPSDKLNIAFVGIGGIGRSNLAGIVGQNVVALCDVDWEYSKPVLNQYPKAQKWKDYREMFDKQKDIDACVVSTPDHTHALPAMIAMQLGKHVIVEKPLTHSIWESRQLKEAAKKYKVAAQMGNEGHSNDTVRRVAEIIRSGVIGEVTQVYLWTDRPMTWWPQGIERPVNKVSVPDTLSWDLFLGPKPWRPYHPAYTPFRWRGWWDFGTGALGDMGCHLFDVVVYALNLSAPTSVNASSTPVFSETAPLASRVEYLFPTRPGLPSVNMPEVKVTWFDGGLLPPRPDELQDGEKTPGVTFVGSKGKLVCEAYGGNFKVLPIGTDISHVKETIERIPDDPLGGRRHEMAWVRACKQNFENREKIPSDFQDACSLNEIVLLGNLAIRLQDLNRSIIWDNANMEIKNISQNDKLRMLKSSKFSEIVIPGAERAELKYITTNARESVAEWIKPTYREGWSW
jgi:predicted dehydrogenase